MDTHTYKAAKEFGRARIRVIDETTVRIGIKRHHPETGYVDWHEYETTIEQLQSIHDRTLEDLASVAELIVDVREALGK